MTVNKYICIYVECSIFWFSNFQTLLKREILISFLGEKKKLIGHRKQVVTSEDEVFGNYPHLIIPVNASPLQMFQQHSLCSC